MAHSPTNPLYKKLPNETAADHMRRLRKEFPKKFGMQPGHKVVKQKFSRAQLEAAEKSAAKKAVEEFKASLPAPVESVARTASVQTPAPAAPVIAPAAAPAPLDIPMSNPQPQTIDEREIFSPVPPPDPNAPPPKDVPPPTPASTPSPGASQDGGKYGAMIWAMIVKLMCSIFGPGFEPIVIKDSAGNVVYDESAEGVKVWVNYLASIGVKVFSPVVELWIFMGSYFGLRAGLIINKFRRKKGAAQPSAEKGTPPAPPKPPGETKTTTPPPPPPAAAAPEAPPIGEVETGQEEI